MDTCPKIIGRDDLINAPLEGRHTDPSFMLLRWAGRPSLAPSFCSVLARGAQALDSRV